jgi:MFS family permease
MGAATNIAIGFLVNKISAMVLVPVSLITSAVGPLLFAILSPSWPYWAAAFPAMCLSPIASDTLFTVSNIVITNSFPDKTQALAGGVFNTVSQLGNSIGLAATAMLAAGITHSSKTGGASPDSALLEGYRAAFWMCFAAGVVSCVISCAGLRNAGKIGLKRE